MKVDDCHGFIKVIMPKLDDDERSVALEIYRGIADDGKASLATLSKRTRMRSSRVEHIVLSWPGVYREGRGQYCRFLGADGTAREQARSGGRRVGGACSVRELCLRSGS